MASCCLFALPLSFSSASLLAKSKCFVSQHFRCRSKVLCNRSLPITRCSGADEGSLVTTDAGLSSANGFIISEVKKKAMDIGSGLHFVAFFSDHYSVPMDSEYNDAVDKCRATRLLLEGEEDSSLRSLFVIEPSPLVSPEELCLVYKERYVENIINGEWDEFQPLSHGTQWSHGLVTRSRASAGGAVAAMHIVMLGFRLAAANISGYGFSNDQYGCSVVPSGIFDDVAIAVSAALLSYPEICNSKRPILVINLDVGQNNQIHMFKNDNRVITFSLHGNDSAFSGDSNMGTVNRSGLLDCTGDDYYLAVLSDRLNQLFEAHSPSLVFLQAGVDALNEDISGKLSMTREGLIHRNNIVYTICFTKKIPLVITMGNGFSKPLQACIEAQADVYRTAALRYCLSV